MKKLLFFLMGMLVFVSCDQDDSLPAETQEGKGTFGCLINGNVFKGRPFTPNPYAVYTYEKRFMINRDGYIDSLNSDFTINAYINHPIVEGETYFLGHTSDSSANGNFGKIDYYVKSTKPNEWWGKRYYTTNVHGGELTITKLDTVKRIVSGRFWFDVNTEEYGIVKIRKGRFDAKYRYNF